MGEPSGEVEGARGEGGDDRPGVARGLPKSRGGELTPLARLLARPGSFGFLAAVALLRGRGAAIRFRHDASLAFSGPEVRSVRRLPSEAGAAERYEVVATFLGAVGASGPAPVYLGALAAAEDDAGELRRELLDVFHHRLHELLIDCLKGQDELTPALLLAVGAGTLPLRRLGAGPLLALAPLLVGRARSARALGLGLRHLLGDALGELGAALEIEEFAGDWALLGEGTQLRLGDRRSAIVGESAVVGAWCRDRASRVRVRIGPLPAAARADLSPGGPLFERLREGLQVLVADPVELELELVVAGALSPPLGAMRLGVDFRAVGPSAAGRSLTFPIHLGDPASKVPSDMSKRAGAS